MRLAEIERRITSLDELLDIVGAMRSLASMRVQEAVRALESVRAYGESMAEAVRAALLLDRDEPSTAGAPRSVRGRRALVLCTSEHGFVGGLNERLLEAAEAELGTDDTLLILGSRGAALAEEHGRRAQWSHPMAARLASVPELIRTIEAALYPRMARPGLARVDVIFARYERSGSIGVARRQLLPLELSAERESAALPPLHHLPPTVLLERLTAEYLFARLTEAIVESLAGENGARFTAMEAAHDNIGRRLEQLRQRASQARQEEVTTELLDLVTGEQAVRT